MEEAASTASVVVFLQQRYSKARFRQASGARDATSTSSWIVLAKRVEMS